LAGSSLVPVDGSVLRRFFDDRPPEGNVREVARTLYDRVDSHLKYDKSGEGWGRGDALWACDSGRGNCSDFHSLFIALCRDLKIPAKFEIGFPLPPEPGKAEIAGYHCWAKFLDGERWIGVDISEANKHPERKDFYFGRLPPDRVMFSAERDLELAPKQLAGPVNFLIYPYVEVDGRPYASQTRRFTVEDVP
jgi:transglutaminase-like putative cysteine protease